MNQKECEKLVKEEIKSLEKEYDGNAPESILIENLDKKYSIKEINTKVIIKKLIKNGSIKEVSEGYFRTSIIGLSTKNVGDKMQTQQVKKVVRCNEEQKKFRKLVNDNKPKLLGKVITHRGVEIEIAGAGPYSLRYKIAVAGLSDKEEVEYPVMYLDWDDTALEDDIVPAVEKILGQQKKVQAPISLGVMGGK